MPYHRHTVLKKMFSKNKQLKIFFISILDTLGWTVMRMMNPYRHCNFCVNRHSCTNSMIDVSWILLIEICWLAFDNGCQQLYLTRKALTCFSSDMLSSIEPKGPGRLRGRDKGTEGQRDCSETTETPNFHSLRVDR